ncbi:hypothetical protein RHS02_08640, partial [Rhizoctonia solani]
MKTDKPGQELADNAAIWDLYLEEAHDYDYELVKGRQASLDTLLIFAALFSAIQTAFLIESKNLLQQDSGDLSASLLLYIAQSQQRVEFGTPPPSDANAPLTNPEFQPTNMARWINGIWFISLGLSLSVALIAMLSKEWLTTYLSSRPRPAHKHALLRQARLEGLQGWWALHIMALLPSFIHLSLLLFALDLILYLITLNEDIAIVFAIGVGLILVFDISTIVLGAIFSNCPYVTEASNYLKKALDGLRSLGKRKRTEEEIQHPEALIKDIQALLWLANHSRDPSIVDCSYQAMAGLRHLLKLQSQTVPKTSTDTLPEVQANLPVQLDKSTTSNQLLSTVVQRFVSLLDGSLELPSPEALVDRYVNSIIAIRTGVSVSPAISWFQLLKLIDGVGHSNIASGSVDPNSFANLLIAEMQVINLALHDLEINAQQQFQTHIALVVASAVGSLASPQAAPQTFPLLATLQGYASRWLQLVSLILSHQSNGRAILDSYLLINLLSSMKEAVQPKLLNPPERGSLFQVDLSAPVEFMVPFAYRAPVPYHSDDLLLGALGSIVAVLSMPFATGDDLQLQINQSAVGAYSSLAPVLLNRVLGTDAQLGTEFSDLQDIKPSTLEESMYTVVRCTMITLNCLLKKRHRQNILRLEKRFFPMVGALLGLAADCVSRDRRPPSRAHGPLDALREYLSLINELLDDRIINRDWAEEYYPGILKSIILTVTCALKDNMNTTNDFISPSRLPFLVRLAVDVSSAPDHVYPMLETMASLLSPSQIFTSNFSAECLQEFTTRPKNLMALMKLVSQNKRNWSVWSIVHYIISLAADIKTNISNLESHTDIISNDAQAQQVTPLLLNTISWVLDHRDLAPEEKKIAPEFFLGSVSLMVGTQDAKCRQLITEHPVYHSVVSELRNMSLDATSYWVERYQKAIEELTAENIDPRNSIEQVRLTEKQIPIKVTTPQTKRANGSTSEENTSNDPVESYEE